jgi:3-oxoacyl-[acyl-carrier-protein] synthase II
MSAAIVAFGAVSALGEGSAAVSAGEVGASARVAIAPDDELREAGLAKPFVARAAPSAPGAHDGAPPPFAFDAAAVLLDRALGDCMRDLDGALPGWRARRVGLAVGTSSGGMRSAETLFAALDDRAPLDAIAVERALYSGPLLEVARAHAPDLTFAPATLVLAACASSTVAIGLATRWLAEDACDVVLAGGFDAVSVFVASGFEVLHATSASIPPRPFRVGRDGMALGEGAAIVALVRPADAPRALAFVAGFGASASRRQIAPAAGSVAPPPPRSPMRACRPSTSSARTRPPPPSTTRPRRARSSVRSAAARSTPWCTRSRRRSGTRSARPAPSRRSRASTP